MTCGTGCVAGVVINTSNIHGAIWTYMELFGSILTYFDLDGSIRTYLGSLCRILLVEMKIKLRNIVWILPISSFITGVVIIHTFVQMTTTSAQLLEKCQLAKELKYSRHRRDMSLTLYKFKLSDPPLNHNSTQHLT